MAVDVLLGLQWGDEGKGKIVDFLAPQYQVVCRFQGGPNAGHTLEFDGIKHVLHQIPSGIFRSDITNIIGNGVVLDPVIFKKEIEDLQKLGVDPFTTLHISKRTQLILPSHRLLDAALEQSKGDKKIGSTLRGIGPTYQDKIGRVGLRVGDIQSPEFKNRYDEAVSRHKDLLDYLDYDYNLEELETPFWNSIEFLKNFSLIDSELLVNEQLSNGKTILAEGAQGSLLDIDFGSYPFVTSSNTMIAGTCSGLGVAPRNIGEVFGIFKAYCTRVGSGPFPTELHDDVGEDLRKAGNEFGATTGRPRRCGWLDLPALKYAIMINGVSQLYMMKTDVLGSFDEIEVCTHYKLKDGSVVDIMNFEAMDGDITPIYQTFKSWDSFDSVEDFDDLPPEMKEYIQFIENEVNTPITLVSYGPDRNETIAR